MYSVSIKGNELSGIEARASRLGRRSRGNQVLSLIALLQIPANDRRLSYVTPEWLTTCPSIKNEVRRGKIQTMCDARVLQSLAKALSAHRKHFRQEDEDALMDSTLDLWRSLNVCQHLTVRRSLSAGL